MRSKQVGSKLFTLLFALSLAACGGGRNDVGDANTGGNGGAGGQGGGVSAPPLEYGIDGSIAPLPATVGDGKGGTRPLAAVKDEQGTVSKFVENEIVIAPKDSAELDDFVKRYGATVLGDNTVPTPPPELGLTPDPSVMKATEYLVQLDPSKFDLASFVADAHAANVGGKVTISSESAAKLLAIAVHETAAGLTVSPNFVFDAQGVLTTTQEAGGLDGLALAPFTTTTGGKSGVAAALQYVAANPPSRRSKVAVIDGGFWLDAQGHPMSTSGGLSDLPDPVVQFDFVAGDGIADGENPLGCTGGSLCRWHGNDSASVAAGRIDNKYGAIGTGGSVADPMLFKSDGGTFSTAAALRTAAVWQADVVSMSFGGECDNSFCDAYYEVIGIYPALRFANESHLVLVAAAGNDKQDTHSVPCRSDHVICVGALEDNANTAKGYSNFGQFVDVWAPTDVPAMPRPNNNSKPVNPQTDQTMADGNLVNAGGTSASTPFVAGVAAMLRAYDSSLDSDAVLQKFLDTAWTDSLDSKVTAYLDAYRALRAVAGNLPADGYEPNDTQQSAAALPQSGALGTLAVSKVGDKDYFGLSTSDFSVVTIDTQFTSHMGTLSRALSHDSQCGNVVQVGKGVLGTGTATYKYRVTPDQWYLGFASLGSSIDAYTANVALNPQPFPPDSFDWPSSNDSLTTATVFSQATGAQASIHSANDVDYYRIVNPGTGGGKDYVGFRFDVLSADMPVTLKLFDAGNNEINSATSSSDCQQFPGFLLSPGTYTVRVEAAQRGEYYFAFGDIYLPPKPDWAIAHIIRLELLGPDPQNFLLTSNVDYFRTATNVDYDEIDLAGDGLHLQVLDLAGSVLAEGQPKIDAAGAPSGESISLSSLANQDFIVSVGRVGDESMITPIALPYSLKLVHP
jgi:Subtilase family